MARKGETAAGGLAPLALRAHPPECFGQDEGGAAPAAPLLLRGAVLLAGLGLAALWLPVMPDLVAALAVVALGALIALPWAWAWAVRRGFALGMYQPGGRLRPVMAGAVMRLSILGLAGAMAASLLLLRLAEASPVQWLLVVLAFPLTWWLMVRLAPWSRSEMAGLHAHRLLWRLATLSAVAGLVVLSLVLGWLLPAPAPAPFAVPDAAGPLVAEALAFTHLWAGLERFALGQAAGFGAWGQVLALLATVAGQMAVFAAAATVAVALTLPFPVWSRALGPACDQGPAPPVGWVGPVVAVVLALCLAGAGMVTSWRLAATAPQARPSGQVMTVAERIGDAFYRPGTHAQIQAMRAEAAAQDAALAAGLAQAMEAGFDAMEANVDLFLDRYYSLWGEYQRLFFWVTWQLEGHLQRQLEAALAEGGPHDAWQALLETSLDDAAARHVGLRAAEAALLAERRIEIDNPTRLRLEGRFDPLPALSERFAQDLQVAQTRWAVAGGAGAVTAVLGARVAQRLAARGVLRVAAQTLARAVGLILAFGLDYALVRLDEAQNRPDFRAEIMAEIDQLRSETMATLPQPE